MASVLEQGSVVETAAGKVRGQRVQPPAWPDGQTGSGAPVHRFLGIPYAQSTGGANRFLRAQPLPAWTGVRDVTNYGARAPQPVEESSGLAWRAWIRDRQPLGEDCLVLNVWTPQTGSSGSTSRRPVLFYIHGGGFNTGSGGTAGCDGAILAARGDAVVVTINHRLNLFGHLYFPGADERYADAGNNGIFDIVTALQWVRTNIEAFGGDAANVTLFGQSGGASKVAVLMSIPEAQGLFHKAVIQSASSLIRMATVDEAARCSHALMKELGLEGRDASALQQVPMDKLLVARKQAVSAAGDNFRPVVDGRRLTVHPFDPVAPAPSARIPLLIGTCETELTFSLGVNAANFSLSEGDARRRVQTFVGVNEQQAARLMQRFGATRQNATPSDIMIAVMSEHMYRRNDILAAERKAEQAAAGATHAPAYMYLFTWKTPAVGGVLGTPHTLCIPFVFGTVDAAADMLGTGLDRYALSERVMQAWLAFARTGKPHHPGLPDWSPYTAARRATMIFDTDCSIVEDPLREDRLALSDVPLYCADAGARRHG